MSASRAKGRLVTWRAAEDFDGAAANRDKAHKLLHNALRRRARAHGLELRRSDYGYSLLDVQRRRVDGRNDLTLAEVAVHLDTAFGKS